MSHGPVTILFSKSLIAFSTVYTSSYCKSCWIGEKHPNDISDYLLKNELSFVRVRLDSHLRKSFWKYQKLQCRCKRWQRSKAYRYLLLALVPRHKGLLRKNEEWWATPSRKPLGWLILAISRVNCVLEAQGHLQHDVNDRHYFCHYHYPIKAITDLCDCPVLCSAIKLQRVTEHMVFSKNIIHQRRIKITVAPRFSQ